MSSWGGSSAGGGSVSSDWDRMWDDDENNDDDYGDGQPEEGVVRQDFFDFIFLADSAARLLACSPFLAYRDTSNVHFPCILVYILC